MVPGRAQRAASREPLACQIRIPNSNCGKEERAEEGSRLLGSIVGIFSEAQVVIIITSLLLV
jgi:hypothetical protein